MALNKSCTRLQLYLMFQFNMTYTETLETPLTIVFAQMPDAMNKQNPSYANTVCFSLQELLNSTDFNSSSEK